MREVIELIQTSGVDSDLIKGLIKDNGPRLQEMEDLYERYKTSEDGVPIKTREYFIDGVKQEGKINNRVNNDFFSEIIDTKIGYFVGQPITYMMDKDKVKKFDEKDDLLKRFNTENNIPDLDSETAKMAAICGYCGRLLYLASGIERVMLVKPYECIIIYDENISKPIASFHFYGEKITEGSKIKAFQYVDFYNATYRITYKYQENKEYSVAATIPHLISGVPLFGISNNDELLGDAEKVIELIDAYDRTYSDFENEMEQFRLAYMKAIGAQLTKEAIKEALKTGAFNVPEHGDIAFITKVIDIAAIKELLDRTESNINRFAKHVNMADEQFAGNQTGVAMKYKLLPLESKCITAERKFITGLQYQYQLLAGIWNIRFAGLNFDLFELTFRFTRNFPLNLLEESQIAAALKGVVSDRTLLSLLSFIKDPDKEIEQMKNDAEEAAPEFHEAGIEGAEEKVTVEK